MCQNQAVSVNASEWYVGEGGGGHCFLICCELFRFEKEPTSGSVQKERIRLRGRGGWVRG